MMRSRPRKVESPVVDKTFQRRQTTTTTKRTFTWATLNFIFAIVFCFELFYKPICEYYHLKHPLFWYAACGLAFLFIFNTIVDILRYIVQSLSGGVVQLTPQQKILLGVKDSEPGFKTVTPVKPVIDNTMSANIISPSNYSAYTGSSCAMSPYTTGLVTPQPGSPSPYGCSSSSSPHNLSALMSQAGGMVGASGSFLGGNMINQSGSWNTSFNQTGSPVTPHLSTLFQETPEYISPRSRLHSTTTRGSPLTTADSISDQAALEKYLKEHHEKEYKQQLGSPENSSANTTSFWNYNRTAADYTPVLSKFQYQIACRSPQSTKSTADDPDDPSTYRADEVWLRAGVLPSQVDLWIENLRKWLGQTVISRVAKEIEKVNSRLVNLGSGDMQIGEITIASLKQLAVTKGQHVPALNHVIPFLESSANQEYLVQRIKDLGSTGCMSDFNWKGGSTFRGKPWGEHLPTDSLVVLHMLCTYMDARLPPHPKYPDGKTFTSEHFMKTPDKPNLKKLENLLLYQSRISPPHYKVVIGEEVFDLPKGRNNMFQAILLFLHHIKTNGGMLKRVNLGMSGINILWTVDDRS